MNKIQLTSKNADDRGDNVFIWRTLPFDNRLVLSNIVCLQRLIDGDLMCGY
ncbi:hypothetical protein BDZ94DRAFT_584620 [Collybia nuda]|uniref:Uncharacterized protein n=1 Tax=Collybia nuda TaxID=64659 RepID=A0A9P5XSI5_9AGAR|nr:hypothetical protein BDZ94DRAFT_584620 [Collybia nuda]